MSAHESHLQQDVQPLAERILDALKRKPDKKAVELARALGMDRKEVNRCLSYALAGKVTQDSAYRWSVRATTKESDTGNAENRVPLTELGRLACYYLECIGQDSDKYAARFSAEELKGMMYWHAFREGWQEMDYQSFLVARRPMIAQVIKQGYQKLVEEEI